MCINLKMRLFLNLIPGREIHKKMLMKIYFEEKEEEDFFDFINLLFIYI